MVDTHCHLLKEYYEDIENVIKKMGNNIMIVSATSPKDNQEVLALCEKYPTVYGTLGYHPEEADNIQDADFQWLEDHIKHPKIVGIGEIGLDYHWNKENKTKQKDIFCKQMELAKKYHKCAVIHSRDAIEDTYEIVSKYAQEVKTTIHCFSSSLEMAQKFISLGSKLGIGGVLTFKNSNKLKEIVKVIDLKHLLLETDSPFLTPEPFRGHQNEPYNIIYVAEKIAEIKGITKDEVLRITTDNALSQFDLPPHLC